MNNEINQVCLACGCLANGLTCLQKYGQLPTKYAFSISTYHKGVCGVCEQETQVTEARDFFYPDFTLIKKVKEFLHEK